MVSDSTLNPSNLTPDPRPGNAATTGESTVPRITARRRRRTRNRTTVMGYTAHEKSLVQFSTVHIIVGLICVVLQLIQFTNQTVLSTPQQGLWCGTFFIISGSVCVGLAKTKGLYSTLVMMSFCLVSLFMALTLSSLSWIGTEATAYCQYKWDQCFGNLTESTNNETQPFYTVPSDLVVMEWAVKLADLPLKSNSSEDSDGDITCDDLRHYYCGYNISLGRAMHSLLVLTGVLSSTTSFILATLACSQPSNRGRQNALRRRFSSSVFNVSGRDVVHMPNRPITPWEFPPPSKEPIPSTSDFPDEPPPPYQENENELISHL